MSGYPVTPFERLSAAALRAAVGLPPRALRRLAGRPVVIDGQLLDPESQMFLRMQALGRRPLLNELPPDVAREEYRRSLALMAGSPVPMAEVRDMTVQGGDGPLHARLFVPVERADDDASPLLLWFHGGGYVIGNVDAYDAPCRVLARSAGVRVLAVEYRLAPEHPFPAAIDDAYAALRDAHADPGRFGADPSRIAVGGDSAGGNAAAVCAQRAAAAGDAAAAFQLLVYPVTDFTRLDRPSHLMFAGHCPLTREHTRWFHAAYLGPDADAIAADPAASPLLAKSLAGVAPAHVVTAGYDPVRDESVAYAERLRADGVTVTHRHHPGLMHTFLSAVGIGRAPRDAVAEMGGVLRAGLARGVVTPRGSAPSARP